MPDTIYLRRRTLAIAVALAALPLGPATAQEAQTEEHDRYAIERDADVPELPFDDNPDPPLCGIPAPFGEPSQAFLNGYWRGEPIREGVLLYDSHLRRSVVGSAPHGTEIKVILYQVDPELNYCLVRTVGLDENVEGWIPAPFVRFPGDSDPAAEASSR